MVKADHAHHQGKKDTRGNFEIYNGMRAFLGLFLIVGAIMAIMYNPIVVNSSSYSQAVVEEIRIGLEIIMREHYEQLKDDNFAAAKMVQETLADLNDGTLAAYSIRKYDYNLPVYEEENLCKKMKTVALDGKPTKKMDTKLSYFGPSTGKRKEDFTLEKADKAKADGSPFVLKRKAVDIFLLHSAGIDWEVGKLYELPLTRIYLKQVCANCHEYVEVAQVKCRYTFDDLETGKITFDSMDDVTIGFVVNSVNSLTINFFVLVIWLALPFIVSALSSLMPGIIESHFNVQGSYFEQFESFFALATLIIIIDLADSETRLILQRELYWHVRMHFVFTDMLVIAGLSLPYVCWVYIFSRYGKMYSYRAINMMKAAMVFARMRSYQIQTLMTLLFMVLGQYFIYMVVEEYETNYGNTQFDLKNSNSFAGITVGEHFFATRQNNEIVVCLIFGSIVLVWVVLARVASQLMDQILGTKEELSIWETEILFMNHALFPYFGTRARIDRSGFPSTTASRGNLDRLLSTANTIKYGNMGIGCWCATPHINQLYVPKNTSSELSIVPRTMLNFGNGLLVHSQMVKGTIRIVVLLEHRDMPVTREVMVA